MRRLSLRISVVIPLYNAEKFVIETLDSIINQTHPVDEILVIDDCGSDGSAGTVEQYSQSHPIVKLIRQPHNQGGSAARNRGMAEAINEWILLVDADDTVDPTLVEKQVKLLEQELTNTSIPISAVHSAYVQIDNESQVVSNSVIRGEQLSHQDLFGSLIVRNFIITPTGMLVNKRMIEEFNGFRTDLKISEDFDFYLRLAKAGRMLYIDEVLVNHRRHQTNVTENLSKSLEAGKTIIGMYSLEEIEEAILGRRYSEAQNKQDLAKVLYYLDQYEQGYIVLQGIEDDENHNVTLFLKSLYALTKNQVDLAHSILRQLVSIDEHHIAARNNFAILEAKLGNLVEAKELFEQCLKQSPGYLDATHNLKVLSGQLVNGEYKYTFRELRPNLLRYTSL